MGKSRRTLFIHFIVLFTLRFKFKLKKQSVDVAHVIQTLAHIILGTDGSTEPPDTTIVNCDPRVKTTRICSKHDSIVVIYDRRGLIRLVPYILRTEVTDL